MSVCQVSLDLAPVIIPGHTWQEKLRKVCPSLTPLITPALELDKEKKTHEVSFDLYSVTSTPQALSEPTKPRKVTFDLTPIVIPAQELKTKAKNVSFNLFPEIIPLYRRGEATFKVSFNLTPTIINSQSISGRSRARRVAFDSTRAQIAPQTSQSSKIKFCKVCFRPIATVIPQKCQSGNNSTPRASFNPYEVNPQHVTLNLTTPATPTRPFADMYTYPDSSYSMANPHHGPNDDTDHDSNSTVSGCHNHPTLQRGFNDASYAKETRGHQNVVEAQRLGSLPLPRNDQEGRESRRLRRLAVVAAHEQHVEYEDPGELADIENMAGGERSYKRRIMRRCVSGDRMEEMEERERRR